MIAFAFLLFILGTWVANAQNETYVVMRYDELPLDADVNLGGGYTILPEDNMFVTEETENAFRLDNVGISDQFELNENYTRILSTNPACNSTFGKFPFVRGNKVQDVRLLNCTNDTYTQQTYVYHPVTVTMNETHIFSGAPFCEIRTDPSGRAISCNNTVALEKKFSVTFLKFDGESKSGRGRVVFGAPGAKLVFDADPEVQLKLRQTNYILDTYATEIEAGKYKITHFDDEAGKCELGIEWSKARPREPSGSVLAEMKFNYFGETYFVHVTMISELTTEIKIPASH